MKSEILWHCTLYGSGAQRIKFAKKVHKPPLWVNVINFELNGLDASIWVPWSPSDPKKSWCTVRSIQIHKKQAAFLHLCRLRFTLRFVNLFVEVSRVCGVKVRSSIGYAASLRSISTLFDKIKDPPKIRFDLLYNSKVPNNQCVRRSRFFRVPLPSRSLAKIRSGTPKSLLLKKRSGTPSSHF